MTKRSRRRARHRAAQTLRREALEPIPLTDSEGIRVDQSPDDLFEQAMGMADRDARERAARQREQLEARVRERYREFIRALRDYGVIFEPGEAQKFEIPLLDETHLVWVEIQSALNQSDLP